MQNMPDMHVGFDAWSPHSRGADDALDVGEVSVNGVAGGVVVWQRCMCTSIARASQASSADDSNATGWLAPIRLEGGA